MEIDFGKLAAAVLRQQQQQPSVAREVAVLNSPEKDIEILARSLVESRCQ